MADWGAFSPDESGGTLPRGSEWPSISRTLAGIPVELSVDAPKDKIVMHPEIHRQLVELALRDALDI